MIIRIGHWIVGWIAGFVATLTVVAAGLTWTLAAGRGIGVDALIPYVERALEPADGAFEVEADAARLHWSGWHRAPNIRVEGVRVKGRDGEVATALPELMVTFSLRALVRRGVLAPVQIDVLAPVIRLARDEHGAIGLRGIGPEDAADAGGGDRFAALFRAAVGRLLESGDPDEPLGYLSALRVVGGRALFDDRITGLSLAAADAEVTVARAPTGLQGRLGLALEQAAGSVAAVQAVYGYRAADGSTDLGVEFGNLDPAPLAAALGPAALPIDRLDLRLDGRVGFTVDAGGGLSPIAFELSAADAALLPTEALPRGLAFERVRARGRVEAGTGRLRLDEFEASSDGTNVRARAVLDWNEAPFAAWAEAAVDRLRADQLERYWPTRLEPKVRAWVLGNVTAGVARDGTVELRLSAADAARRRLSPDALSGRFDFAGMAVRYLDEMPPATDLAGEARFTADRMDFTIARGRVGGLRARSGTVALTGLARKDGERAAVAVDAEGPVPGALALIDHPPLGFLAGLGIDPAHTSGRVRADVRIGFPLARRIEPGMVAVAVEAEVRDGAVPGLLAGAVDLTDAALRLRADNRALDLDGRATLAGVPMGLSWRENFAATADPKRRFGATGRLDLDAAAPPGSVLDGLRDYVQGRPDFDVAVVQPRSGNPRIDAAVALHDAALEIEALAWRKPVGAPGQLHLRGEVRDSGALLFEELRLSAAGLEAEGSLRLAPGSFRPATLDLARLTLGDTATAVRWRPIAGGGHALDLDAEALDLRPLVAAWREEPPPEEDEGGDGAGPPLRITLRTDRLILPGGALLGVEGRLGRDAAGVWEDARLSGTLEGGGEAGARLARDGAGGGHRLTVVAADAGALLRAAGLTPTLQGGVLTLSAALDAQVPDPVGSGALRIDDVMVTGAPRLARLLTLASMTGIANVLQGRGIAFDAVEVPFRFGPDGVRVVDARASGSQIGLTATGSIGADGALDLTGTIVPLYGLSRAVAQVPILGALLTGGGDDEGIFAANYSVRGSRDDPEFGVNPLAALAPGIVRELIEGIASGTLEPPVVGSPRDR